MAFDTPATEPRTPDAVDVYVGARIRARRRELRMSQETLADTLGLTFQQVQKYERAANRVSASKLWAIAAALSCDVGDFFGGLPEEGPRAAIGPSPALSMMATREGETFAGLWARLGATARRGLLLCAQAAAGKGEVAE